MRQNKCERPQCDRKFGLIRQRKGSHQYCSEDCKRKHTAEETAKHNEAKRRFHAWLNGQA